jgi:hypothetical protein
MNNKECGGIGIVVKLRETINRNLEDEDGKSSGCLSQVPPEGDHISNER